MVESWKWEGGPPIPLTTKDYWAGYAFPGGHIEEGESLVSPSFVKSTKRQDLQLQIQNWSQSDWPQMRAVATSSYLKTTEFTGQLRSSDEGEVSWSWEGPIRKLVLSYIMLPLLEVMEDPDLSEYIIVNEQTMIRKN